MKNLFFPNKNNDFHPHIVRPILAGLLLISIIIVKFFILQTSEKRISLASDLAISNIINGINQERLLRNLPALKTDSRLSFAAQQKSDDMQARHYFSHTDPEGNYIWDKITAAGYSPYSALGENLAIEFYNTESLVTAWMNSPTHRQNVLNEAFKDQGMGLAFGNSEQSQYHSAIANTFGALLITKQPVTQKIVTSPKKPSPTPASTVNKPAPTIVQPPQQTPSAVLQPAGQAEPLNVRVGYGGSPVFNNTKGEDVTKLEETQKTTGAGEQKKSDALAVVGQAESLYTKNYRLNMGLAALLILLLLADLKLFQKAKYPNLDKKLNNLSLVFLAVLLTGFLYWL